MTLICSSAWLIIIYMLKKSKLFLLAFINHKYNSLQNNHSFSLCKHMFHSLIIIKTIQINLVFINNSKVLLKLNNIINNNSNYNNNNRNLTIKMTIWIIWLTKCLLINQQHHIKIILLINQEIKAKRADK